MNSQKRRIVVLCIVLVGGGGWAALAARGDGSDEPMDNQVTEPAGPFLDAPNLSPATDVSLGDKELFLKMMLSVGLVIGLGAAALYLSKRVLPRMANAAGKEIRIVETACLGPRRALHLVEVGQQRLLIASTNDSITMLAHIGDTWLEIPKRELDGTVSV